MGLAYAQRQSLYYKAAFGHASFYEQRLQVANELYRQGGKQITSALILFEEIWSQVQRAYQWASTNLTDPEIATMCDQLVYGGGELLVVRHSST